MSLHLICLCAEWCGTCRDFRVLFDRHASSTDADCALWLDIETHEDLLDDLGIEVENFPTLVIARSDHSVCFAGPITPFAETLARLCRAARADELRAPVEGRWQALLTRLGTTDADPSST